MKILAPQQLQVFDAPAPTPHKDMVSPVVQQLESVAVSDPAYANGQTRNSRNMSQSAPAPPPPATSVSPLGGTPKPVDPAAFQPLAYNPAAPAAPEPIRHREKTPPPDDGATGTGLAAAAMSDHPVQTPGLPYQPGTPFGPPKPGVGFSGPPPGQGFSGPPQAPQYGSPPTSGMQSPLPSMTSFPGPPQPLSPPPNTTTFHGPPQPLQSPSAHMTSFPGASQPMQGLNGLPQGQHYGSPPPPTASAMQSPPPSVLGGSSFPPPPPGGAPSVGSVPSRHGSQSYAPPPQAANSQHVGSPVITPGTEILGSPFHQPPHQPLQHLQPQYPDYLASHNPQVTPPPGGFSSYNYSQPQHQPHHHHANQQANPYDIHSQAYRPTEAEASSHGKQKPVNPNAKPGRFEEGAERVEKRVNRFLKRLDKGF